MTDLEEYLESLDRMVKAVKLTAYWTNECADRTNECAEQTMICAYHVKEIAPKEEG